MPWSTSEIADLANVTVNTVRYYHSVGLLDLPERDTNGYKRYTARHLVCLVRIRRLTELGVPLASIEQVGSSGPEAQEELRAVDAVLAADLAKLRRSREDIAAILHDQAPIDTPRGFESVAARLSPADRAVLHVVTRLADDDEAVASLRDTISRGSIIAAEEFAALRADASERSRERVAERFAAESSRWRSIDDLASLASGRRPRRSPTETRRIIADTFLEVYNPAQRDVVERVTARSDELIPSLREATSAS
ncbi:MerR family transcriptional regulator [Labedella endophytica]|uniref:MerR family transcriptional regulator n=1 Tax=Labedella endophytica TaxID=1523160 RepID=A0A433JPT7_9MICO|nr:MerR family transcriptional regulator [Labedella endophytica]RUQ98142.1 MerR family transcriptional regulator [Labedella endophytica]